MSKNAGIRRFYQSIASRHRLFYGDWPGAVRREGTWLKDLLEPLGVRSVLDCTCGIGTQAVGLALNGFNVVASDLSEENLAEAARGAAEFGVTVRWQQADVRRLDEVIVDEFDAVISLGNSLSHLLTEEGMLQALRNMRDRVRSGGLVLLGERDWDGIQRERPRFNFRHVHRDTPEPGQRTILFDLWHYSDPLVTFEVFFMQQAPTGWTVEVFPLRYRMWQRRGLVDLMEEVGLIHVRQIDHPWEVRLAGQVP